MLEWTPKHSALFNEYLAARRWGYADERSARAAHPKGLHRLAHLVPDFAPDQVALAKLLAETAIIQKRQGADPFIKGAITRRARRLFRTALHNDLELRRIADMAPTDADAWQACELFMDPQARMAVDVEDGQLVKVVKDMPAPVQRLRDSVFTGVITRPRCKSLDARDDAIRFAVWMTLEADIEPTSKVDAPSACATVADVLRSHGIADIGEGTVAGAWKVRENKPDRKGKYA